MPHIICLLCAFASTVSAEDIIQDSFECGPRRTCAKRAPASGASLMQLKFASTSSTGSGDSERHDHNTTLTATFERLHIAVETGNMEEVEDITANLRAEASRRVREKAILMKTSSRNYITVKQTPPSTCIFDDQIFKLTPEAKSALSKELQDATVASKLYSVQGNDPHFNLTKNVKSSSYFQDAWVLLLRFLGQSAMLPATGDRLYHGSKLWGARGGVMERRWIDLFIEKIVATNALGPRCMQWGQGYLTRVPTCTELFDMRLDTSVYKNQKKPWFDGNFIYSDIEHLPFLLSENGDHRMNLIFATQVFEHLADPRRSAAQLFQSLLPSGALVFTAPHQSQFHLVPSDYFRYTKMGAVSILQHAGFCIPDWAVMGGGDFIYAIGQFAGLSTEDFPEIDSGIQIGYSKVSDAAITIHVLAFKPPHKACNEALPSVDADP